MVFYRIFDENGIMMRSETINNGSTIFGGNYSGNSSGCIVSFGCIGISQKFTFYALKSQPRHSGTYE